MTSIGPIARQLLALGFLAIAWAGWSASGHSQALPPYSIAVGLSTPTGLTTLPGLNDAQQMMAQSINNVCPTINSIALTPNQRDLAAVCGAMIGTAVQLQNQPNPLGLPSYGISAGALGSALESLNGGAELVVPTSQSSSLQMQQTQQITEVVEGRLSMLRKPVDGTELAALPRFSQLAQATAPWSSDASPSPEPTGSAELSERRTWPFTSTAWANSAVTI